MSATELNSETTAADKTGTIPAHMGSCPHSPGSQRVIKHISKIVRLH